MKKLYFILIISLLSSCKNNSDVNNQELIKQIEEKRQDNLRLMKKLKQLENELDHCGDNDCDEVVKDTITSATS